jgi:hypothetical protein
MKRPKKNTPKWHTIQEIIRQIKENGFYEEPTNETIDLFRGCADTNNDRIELFKEFGINLTQKGSNYIFELTPKDVN